VEILFVFYNFSVYWICVSFSSPNGLIPGDADVFSFLVIFCLTLAASGFTWGVLTIKCPKCKARLLWNAVKDQSHQNWFLWFVSFEKCPKCKNSAGSLSATN
jgi:phage FluMu protein Com